MSDPLRTETSRASEPASKAEREAKIEQLLLAGLDDYFAARYEQAINVWTRALFLDRSHARARAYIERARSAQAERLRESEALLHDGAEAIRRGDSAEARRLLEAAMRQSGSSDEVLALLDRVERFERTAGPLAIEVDDSEPRLALDEPRRSRRPRAAWILLGGLVLVIVAAALFAFGAASEDWGPLVRRTLGRRGDRTPATTQTVVKDVALPLPRRAEGNLARARALMSSGRLHDALPLLEQIKPTDAERPDADQLRGEIQRRLIQIGASPVALSSHAADGTTP